ncbi:MAG: hypothetical protein ACKVP7_27925 [Hyphomicrobiaceae bacterium]
MRSRMTEVCVALLVGGALAASLSAHASAAETLVCADGRTLSLDDSSRAKLANDPCFKDWVANTEAAAATKAAAARRSVPETSERGETLGRRPEPAATVVVRKYSKTRSTVLDSSQR